MLGQAEGASGAKPGERRKILKKAVNSAAERVVALAKPEESAMELLIRFEALSGVEMLDSIDFQGILDKAGIQVPPQIAKYFMPGGSGDGDSVSEGGSPDGLNVNVSDLIGNFNFLTGGVGGEGAAGAATVVEETGKNILSKVLDDQRLVGKTDDLVTKVEGVLDKASELSQNKMVQR